MAVRVSTRELGETAKWTVISFVLALSLGGLLAGIAGGVETLCWFIVVFGCRALGFHTVIFDSQTRFP
jgi:hypothetical protein